MALSKELCGILAAGVEKEKAAHDFYARAAEKTLLPLGQRMFKMLAAEETKHEKLLMSWSSAGARGFKGSRKSTPFAAQVAAGDAAAKAMEHANRLKQREVDILAREFNPGAPAAEIKPSDGQVPELSDGQELGGDGEAYVVDGRR
jgi:hypothetical protein